MKFTSLNTRVKKSKTQQGSWEKALSILALFKNQLIYYTSLSAVGLLFLLYCYPYLAISSDSGSYVTSAINKTIGFRPYGYSVFLSMLNGISPSMTIVAMAQMLIYSVSAIVFILVVENKLGLMPLWKSILWGTAVLACPSAWYLSNCLLSDSLFTSLTVLYLTSIIGLIYSHNIFFASLHLLVLFCLLYVRFTAIAYLPVSGLVLYYSFSNKWKFAFNMILILMVGLIYYSNTKAQFFKATSIETFSPFAGWLLLNDAMHVYPEVRPKPVAFSDRQTREIVQFVNLFPDSTFLYSRPHTLFMWSNSSPLKQYMYKEMNERKWSYFKTWVYLGDPFNEAAKTIIWRHPGEFFIRFVLPSMKSLLLPGPGFCYTFIQLQDQTISKYYNLEANTLYKPRLDAFKAFSNENWVMRTSLLFWILTAASIALLIWRRRRFNIKERLVGASAFIFIVCYSAINLISGIIEIRYLTPVHAAQVLLILMALSAFDPVQNIPENS